MRVKQSILFVIILLFISLSLCLNDFGSIIQTNDYLQLAEEFINKANYRTALYCLERYISLVNNKMNEKKVALMALTCLNQLDLKDERLRYFESILETYNNQPSESEKRYFNALQCFQINHSNRNLITISQLSNDLQNINLLPKFPFKPLYDLWTMNQLSCFLNATYPLVDFDSVIIHANVMILIQDLIKAKHFLEIAKSLSNSIEQMNKIIYSYSFYMNALLERLDDQEIPFIETFLNDNQKTFDFVIIADRQGDLELFQSSLIRRWKNHILTNPLSVPLLPTDINRFQLVFDWFDYMKNDNHSNRIQMQTITHLTGQSMPIDHQPFGQSQPHFLIDSLTNQEMIENWQRINMTFIDRSAAIFFFDEAFLDIYQNIYQQHLIFSLGPSSEFISSIENLDRIVLGRIAITNVGQWTYYHSMIESLSRLLIIHDHILTDSQYSDVKVLLERSPWIVSFFRILNFDLNRVIWQQKSKYYHSQQLIAVNWQIFKHANDATHQRVMPPKWMLLNLRSRFLSSSHVQSAIELYTNQHKGDQTIVYMQRSGSTRFVQHNEWLKWNIRQLISKQKGWKLVIHTGNEEIEKQIAIFHHSSIVIGPHGAATANTLFCRPGTHVIEFPGGRYRGDSTNYISATLDLEYWITAHVCTSNWGFYKTDRWKINSILSTLQTIINRLNDSNGLNDSNRLL